MSISRSWLWRMGLSMPQHKRVFACFFLYSFCMGGFFPRLAEIQRAIERKFSCWYFVDYRLEALADSV